MPSYFMPIQDIIVLYFTSKLYFCLRRKCTLPTEMEISRER